jgi:hypothetical protein
MSRVLKTREADTIRRIEEREKLAQVRRRNTLSSASSSSSSSSSAPIPKKASYYTAQANKLQTTDPHHAAIYRKAATLSSQKKHVEVTNLLKRANQAIDRNRVPAAPPRQSALMQRLRNIGRAPPPISVSHRPVRVTRSMNVRRLEEEYNPETLDEYVVDYSQKVKKRKELLIQFLKRHFENHEKYSARAQRFVTIRSNRGRRRA